MEALPNLHHRHQPLCSSIHFYCPFLTPSTSSSLFLSPPSSSPPSSSIRASSSPSPPSSDPPPQNLQYPEAKTPQFFNPLPTVSSFDPHQQSLQYPEAKYPQFFDPLRKVPSFATITAASAFLFLGLLRNRFINKPITSLSSIVSIQEALDENSSLNDFLGCKPDHVQSILHLKLKEKVPVVHSFNKTKTDDEEAWQVLKAQVFSCSEELELVKIGFEQILEKDQDCNKAYHDCVLEYLEMVDECKSLLKGIKVAMCRCERENADIKHCLRFFSKLVGRIKVMEGDMVGALKHFKELEQEKFQARINFYEEECAFPLDNGKQR
ncbi:uncharacterized protein LOC133292807 [Gastrolobium bilobum]|uniref:uncharacterized protein LOC133292807 n=1 Tax=Gastrolobium bilobum TaxID=150636 RepID=UPI002AAFA871|nr:uncharacterized protein LOC133292807 [Gastrolobium bilobum]